MKKQYKTSIIKNHKVKEPLTKPLKLFLDFAPEIKKRQVGNIQ